MNRRIRLGEVRRARVGFTLLEVILALAILGVAMATLGQAITRSHRSAQRATNQTELTFIAASVLDEVLIGARPLSAVSGEPIPDPSDPTAPPLALVSVAANNSPYDGLIEVRVEARANDPTSVDVDRVTLVRWMLDPSLTESTSASEGGAL